MSVSADDFLYSGIAAVILAKKLIAAGIPVKVNAVIGMASGAYFTCCIVPLKNYDEPLDVNLLALVTSDPRFFRYEALKACYLMQNLFHIPVDTKGLNGNKLKEVLQANKYRVDVPNRVYLGMVSSKEEVLNELELAIARLAKG